MDASTIAADISKRLPLQIYIGLYQDYILCCWCILELFLQVCSKCRGSVDILTEWLT